MEEANINRAEQTQSRDLTLPRTGVIAGLLTIFFIALFVFLSVRDQLPPSAAGQNAPPSEFSSGRAIKYVQAVSQHPHPMGTAEHARVREYIMNELTSLGLAPEVQQAETLAPLRGQRMEIGIVNNVVARLTGTGGAKAVMLVGHYDSTPTSLGASDDGSAVALMLETLRALKAGPPLKNDVIFLFTDGEEIGLLGAKAFVDRHQWAQDVGLVLNFEARGTKGPSLMFETSDENGWLVKEFGKAGPEPVASSIFYEIYKYLPNFTDLTVFKLKGFSGLNFAFVGGLAHYHTLSDSIENIDERSLQHQGLYALALTRHFGNLDLENIKERNDIFFNTLGPSFIHYSEKWTIPLSALVSLLLVGVLFIGLRRKLLTTMGILAGFFAQLAAMVCSAVVVTLVMMIDRALHSDYRLFVQGSTYNNNLYVISFISLAVAVTTGLYLVFGRRMKSANLMAGGLLWWVLLAIASSIYLPGASYLFTFPPLFILIALGVMFAAKGERPVSAWHLALFYVCSIPALALSIPILYLMALGAPTSLFRVMLVLVVLLLALLLPLVRIISAQRPWWLPGATALIAIGFLVAGSLTSGFNKNEPKPTNLFYVLNADNGKAIWASSDRQPDEWTAQFFPEGTERGTLSDYMPADNNRTTFLSGNAPAVPLPTPGVEVVSDTMEDGTRILQMHITANRPSPVLSVFVESDVEITGMGLNGKRLVLGTPRMSDGGRVPEGMRRPKWALSYYAPPPEGLTLTLETKAPPPLRIRVVDQSYEFPDSLIHAYKAQPDYMMPTPYPFNPYGDAIFVTRTFNL